MRCWPAMRKAAGQWLASAIGAAAFLGLIQLAAPWLGFSLRVGPGLGIAAVLGLPGMILLLALRLLCYL